MRRPRGLTLVEMLIALLIGSLVTLAVVSVLRISENGRRRAIDGSDTLQVGSHALAQIDRLLRSAGSGYTQSASHLFGCRLHAARAGTQLLPVPSGSSLPAPFAAVNPGSSGVFRLAPALIAAGQTTPQPSGRASDVLILMSGHSGQSDMPMNFSADPMSSTLTLDSTLGLSSGEMILVGDRQPASTGTAPCMLSEVSSSFDASVGRGSVPLAGSYWTATVESTSLSGFSSAGTVHALGNVGAGNPPEMQLVGVGDGGLLAAYDLLQTTAPALQALADNVFALHARYGFDTNGDRVIDSWTEATGNYAIAALMDGSAAANARLRTIIALRVGLVMRSARPDLEADADKPPTDASLTLFSDLGGSLVETLSLSKAERLYRYRTLETTVPLRNLLIQP
ncbi:MAG: type pilus assembly protein PilW [Pseudomonadota bacterium]|nr:type pilus assembly protein PilW [Pseudomonadota bacterium]